MPESLFRPTPEIRHMVTERPKETNPGMEAEIPPKAWDWLTHELSVERFWDESMTRLAASVIVLGENYVPPACDMPKVKEKLVELAHDRLSRLLESGDWYDSSEIIWPKTIINSGVDREVSEGQIRTFAAEFAEAMEDYRSKRRDVSIVDLNKQAIVLKYLSPQQFEQIDYWSVLSNVTYKPQHSPYLNIVITAKLLYPGRHLPCFDEVQTLEYFMPLLARVRSDSERIGYWTGLFTQTAELKMALARRLILTDQGLEIEMGNVSSGELTTRELPDQRRY